MNDDLFSARSEPVFQREPFAPDPSEKTAEPAGLSESELEQIRDSVRNEPAITGADDSYFLGDWIARKRAECSRLGNLAIGAVTAVLTGPFAVLGVFLAGNPSWYGSMYMILFGPIIEEMLKQAGMVYLLEKKPYRLFASWQFVFSAIVAALTFASIENLLYIHLYSRATTIRNPELYALFRWTVCTSLHVTCSIIASLGLIRVWRKQLADGKNADLSPAYPFFAAAMCLHGFYNLSASLLDRILFR